MSKDQTSEQPTIFKLSWWLVFTGIIVVLIGADLYFSGLSIGVLFLAGSLMSASIAYLIAVLSVQFNVRNEVILPMILLFLLISISVYVYGCVLWPREIFTDIISLTVWILGEVSFACKFINTYFKRERNRNNF